MRIVGATASHVGQVREINQDRSLVSGTLGAVADGMGGHVGGEKAAAMAIAEISGVRGAISEQRLVTVIESANRRIHESALLPELRGMGTTIVAATFDAAAGVMSLANVGDSRGYLFRNGELKQITVDHSLVEDLVRQGRLTAEEARTHPQRNIVTRALGIGPEVEVDAFAVQVELNDRIVLASDGLFNEVEDSGIVSILGRLASPQDAVDELVRVAVDNGGRDNVTVVVLDVVDEAQPEVALDETVIESSDEGVTVNVDEDDVGLASDYSDDLVANTPRPRKRRLPFRSLLLAIGVLGVLAVAFGGTAYYARSGWFADDSEGEVAILRGRPGGVLWFRPSVVENTEIPVEQLDGASVERLRQQTVWSSRADACDFVRNFTLLDGSGASIPDCDSDN